MSNPCNLSDFRSATGARWTNLQQAKYAPLPGELAYVCVFECARKAFAHGRTGCSDGWVFPSLYGKKWKEWASWGGWFGTSLSKGRDPDLWRTVPNMLFDARVWFEGAWCTNLSWHKTDMVARQEKHQAVMEEAAKENRLLEDPTLQETAMKVLHVPWTNSGRKNSKEPNNNCNRWELPVNDWVNSQSQFCLPQATIELGQRAGRHGFNQRHTFPESKSMVWCWGCSVRPLCWVLS